MYLEILERVKRHFSQVVETEFGVRLDEPAVGFPPDPGLGDLSVTSCFELAKRLRQPPRRIAETVAAHMLPLDGVERVSIAGAGFLNLYLDRAGLASALFQARVSAARPTAIRKETGERKVLVEHTSINPNKAAHVGHLRNSVLGDTFARLLRFAGEQVEVQNYIDNTGVQVADVVVGFTQLEGKSVADVQSLISDPDVRFDYYCWDLYARVTQAYERDPVLAARRAETLKAIEESHGEAARMAELLSTTIVRAHLETARRLGIRYDLLVQESEILTLNFWKYAFELLRVRGAVRLEDSGKNKGCWVMTLTAEKEEGAEGTEMAAAEIGDEETKVIVRSNGTVTYVGKDIAYHLWKFGLLGRDFEYELFYSYPDGHLLWRTTDGGQGSEASGQASGARGQGPRTRDPEVVEGAEITPANPQLVESAPRIPDPRPLDPDPKPPVPVPSFGHASAAYVVIDSRQSYLQRVVAAAFRELGYGEQATHLHHFSYEKVNLSLEAARSLGIEPSPEDRDRNYVEVSGRRGLGVKADDLIDMVIEKALTEVRERQMTSDPAKQVTYSHMIGVAALRYFLLKFTRRSTIAFDFKDALAFEGETGPYLQYSVVRAQNIFRKAGIAFQGSGLQVRGSGGAAWPDPQSLTPGPSLRSFLEDPGARDFWELVLLAAQLEMAVRQAVESEEPAVLAKYAFRLAQAFNNFYHHHRVLSETDAERHRFLLFLVYLASRTLALALEVLGVEIPEHM